VDAIFGIKSGKSEIQALRFDKSKFSPEEARAWADKHGYKGSLHKAKPKSDHDEGAPAPAGSAGITVTTALRKDLSVQYAEDQNEIDDDFGEDLIDLLCDKDFDFKELQKGLEHELEHTSDRAMALKFAFDHLEEHSNYYSVLNKAEKTMDHASKTVHKEFEKEPDPEDPNELDEDEFEVEAFSTGTHTSSEGEVCSYSSEDLDNIVKKYEETKNTDPAPVCLGHPADSSPAYAWIKSAKRVGDKLVVKLHQMNENFVDALKNHAYKKVSLSLYDSEDGPRIRHLAWLGAQPPAVRGLAIPAIAFASSDKYKTFTEEFEMSKDTVDVKDLTKKLAWYDKLFNMFKLEVNKDYAEEPAKVEAVAKPEETKVVNHSDDKSVQAKEQGSGDNQAGSIVEKETKDPGEATSASASEKEVKAKVTNEANEAQDELSKLKTENASLKSELEILRAALNVKNHTEAEASKKSDRLFCEDLVKQGKLRPADLDMTILNLEARSNLDEIRNYSEEQSAAKKYREALTAAPKLVEFGEFPQVPNMTTAASIPDVGMAEYLEKAIKDKMAATPNISYWDSMKECYAEAQKKDPVKFAEYMKALIPSR
jgi:hypothetical protein